MIDNICNKKLFMRILRHTALFIVLLSLLIGCATTDDPEEGGFFSIIHSLSTGAYDKRIERKQAELEEAKRNQVSIKEQARQADVQIADVKNDLEIAQKRLSTLKDDLNNLLERIQQAEKIQEIENADLQRLKSEVNALSKEAALVSRNSEMSVEDKKQRLDDLTKRKKKLEEVFQTALGL